jgi:ElaB/YqjD/DUF883 family membrane-anchored ribosome-binding protein
MANDPRTQIKSTEGQAEQTARDVAERADQAIQSTRRAANGALDTMHQKVDELADAVPGAISRAAARVDEITRQGIERARQTSSDVRNQVVRAGDRTVSYIQDEPVKSVLIAAAAGAAIVALVSLLTRSQMDRR